MRSLLLRFSISISLLYVGILTPSAHGDNAVNGKDPLLASFLSEYTNWEEECPDGTPEINSAILASAPTAGKIQRLYKRVPVLSPIPEDEDDPNGPYSMRTLLLGINRVAESLPMGRTMRLVDESQFSAMFPPVLEGSMRSHADGIKFFIHPDDMDLQDQLQDAIARVTADLGLDRRWMQQGDQTQGAGTLRYLFQEALKNELFLRAPGYEEQPRLIFYSSSYLRQLCRTVKEYGRRRGSDQAGELVKDAVGYFYAANQHPERGNDVGEPMGEYTYFVLRGKCKELDNESLMKPIFNLYEGTFGVSPVKGRF